MKIKNHLLYLNDHTQVSYKPTPNKGGKFTPQYLIMHYTAATTANSAISWFMSPLAQASAHLVIGRDGDITQMAPFNVICWHAGQSKWGNINGLNQYSIGIEMVNAGRLSIVGDKYVSKIDKVTIKETDVLLATHKNETRPDAWHEYTPKQIDACINVAAALVGNYALKDILGHEDVSPGRKSDPGPAFPMNSFKSKALGRKDEFADTYITVAELNIRSGAGTSFSTITNPLPTGTKVLVLKREGNWSFVEVIDFVHGIMDLEGWVASKYLEKI